MVLAAELSHRVLGLERSVVERIRSLVAAIGCPVQAPDLGVQRWLDLMRLDKKNRGTVSITVSSPELGRAQVQAVADEDVRPLLTAGRA
ncbi:3-dehydroquinate synthase OS=Castellaniella defragrans OX=75697 GN=aroB PE=3 SV=1 [Castellaniella defragrans]